MSDMKLGGLVFDRGIDRITHARQDATGGLPERGESAPAETGARAQLDTLLAQPSLDDVLETVLRPQLEHRELMVPARFRAALDDVLQRLGTEAEAAPASGADADQTRILNRAVRLLKEECGLRDLVQMYRSTLYQG